MIDPSRVFVALAIGALALGACGGNNNRLTISSSPATSGEARVAYSYSVGVSNSVGTVTYAVTSGPSGLTISGVGLVQWTPALDDLGTHAVIIQASDGSGTISQAWNLRIHQGLGLGVTLSPRGHTSSTTMADLVAHFDPESGVGRVRAFHSAWREAMTDDGEIPGLGVLAGDSAATYGFTLAMGFGWSDGTGAPDLASESEPGNNTWTNAETRSEYRAMVVSFAQTYRPPFLFLGNETNGYALSHSPGEWAAWVTEFEECYDAIKAVSPETVIYTTFQLERMKGVGVNNGWSNAPQWALIADHVASGKIDAIGFTSYPYFEYSVPSVIPASYYDEIATYWSGPVVFSEIGWLAAANAPYPGGEADQAAFVSRFFELTGDLDLDYVTWLFLHDWDGAIPQAFANIALRSNDASVVRAADPVWQVEVALRQQ